MDGAREMVWPLGARAALAEDLRSVPSSFVLEFQLLGSMTLVSLQASALSHTYQLRIQ